MAGRRALRIPGPRPPRSGDSGDDCPGKDDEHQVTDGAEETGQVEDAGGDGVPADDGDEGDRARAGERGRTNTEIAAELFISLSTVKSHLASIHNKLGVRNRVEIAGWAWETGLAQPASD